jgi:hypothetical protein
MQEQALTEPLCSEFRDSENPAVKLIQSKGLFCLTALLLSNLFYRSSLSARPLNVELYDLLRSGRWSTIIGQFRNRNPVDPGQRFALARALEEEKRLHRNPDPEQIKSVIAEYLRAAGLFCTGDLTACVESGRASGRGILRNLAILRAGKLAEKLNDTRLRAGILLQADLSNDNPVTRRIFADALLALFNLKEIDRAHAYMQRNTSITGGSVYHARGKIYAALNRKQEAIDSYIRAASGTSATWVLRAIYRDLTSIAPDYPETPGLTDRERRAAVFFYDQIPSARITISPQTLIATTSAETIKQDGMFLIQSNQEAYLKDLAARGYTYLSREPDVLRLWVDELAGKKNAAVALNLVQQFAHARLYHSGLWKAYLELLKDSNREVYFNELLEYLTIHHSDIQVHDRLINFLIGDHPEKIRWAEQRYWEMAATRLPAQTGCGRFVYWLWRYYREFYPGRAKELSENFYRYAPGSYYAVPFWEQVSTAKDYETDWRGVSSLNDYYRWISAHGGNDEALRFLSRKSLYGFYNQEAVRLSRELYVNVRPVDQEIVEILSLGEFAAGFEWFKEKYGDLPDVEYLKNLVAAGIQSRNRFIEVYYLRLLLRRLNIPEDPFVLPPRLLEALYPRPYRNIVQRYAREYGMHEDMIYGLMRQESMFREVAESRSGALGLMQIMPKTGAWLAGRMGIKEYDLTDPETSIRFGTKFFSDLMRSSERDFRWASISYNGGPGNMRKWKQQYYRGDFNYFLEVLPVEESRNYVRKTYENYLHYHVARILYDPGIR